MAPGAQTKSLTIVRRLDAAAGPAWADPHRLQQIVPKPVEPAELVEVVARLAGR